MNENEAVKALTMCKDYLQKSHSIVCVNFPNANRGSKSIIEALSRIDPIEHGKKSSQSKTSENDTVINADGSATDHENVANTLLAMI